MMENCLFFNRFLSHFRWYCWALGKWASNLFHTVVKCSLNCGIYKWSVASSQIYIPHAVYCTFCMHTTNYLAKYSSYTGPKRKKSATVQKDCYHIQEVYRLFCLTSSAFINQCKQTFEETGTNGILNSNWSANNRWLKKRTEERKVEKNGRKRNNYIRRYEKKLKVWL